jgi:D-3-phosphoglycerate dehydrogenase
MPRILVSENITGSDMDALRKQMDVTFEPDLWKDAKRLREIIVDYDAIMVRNQTKVTADLINAGKELQVIGRAGVGLDNVDCDAANAAGVVVAYAPEQNSISVAELALGMMLALARELPAADVSAKSGAWDRKRFANGVELYGKTLGLLGLGRIGFLTAMRAKAFGMKIVACDPMVSADSPMVVESGARLTALSELLAVSDFVSCHIPETPKTAKMLGYEQFSKMKPTAYFINTARGAVVDEPGLAKALEEKKIAGAALDVRAAEPPAGPLSKAENVLLMPHIGAFTVEGQERVVRTICRDVAAVLRGEAARNYFNFAQPRKAAKS